MDLDEIIRKSLEEDIGSGDITSLAAISPGKRGKMHLFVKQDGVISGTEIAKKIIKNHAPDTNLNLYKNDTARVFTGDIIFELHGNVRSMLMIERVLLNFMQRMSGIATYTRRLVDIIADLPAKILDTRKTTPLFRVFEKMAVKAGGGYNHRYGLYDMFLIKDNHIDFSGGITAVLTKTFNYIEKNRLQFPVEIEVRNLNELEEVLHFGKVNRIMFDNFNPPLLKKAVQMVNKTAETEASGSINETNIRMYAETGVDYISIGALTHRMHSLDMTLKST